MQAGIAFHQLSGLWTAESCNSKPVITGWQS